MNWRQILPRAKAERAALQKQANNIEAELDRLDKVIFEAERGIKKMDERRSKGLKIWAKVGSDIVDCYSHPDNPPCCGEGE